MTGASYVRALMRDRRGVAQVELIVALPTLIAALACVLAVFWLGDARHRAHARARACAWDYAIHACDTRHVTLCSAASTRRGEAVKGEGKVLGKLYDIPLLGTAIAGLLGEPAQAEAKQKASLLPGEDRPRFSSARHTLVCAPLVESVAERVKDVLCGLAASALHVQVYGCS